MEVLRLGTRHGGGGDADIEQMVAKIREDVADLTFDHLVALARKDSGCEEVSPMVEGV